MDRQSKSPFCFPIVVHPQKGLVHCADRSLWKTGPKPQIRLLWQSLTRTAAPALHIGCFFDPYKPLLVWLDQLCQHSLDVSHHSKRPLRRWRVLSGQLHLQLPDGRVPCVCGIGAGKQRLHALDVRCWVSAVCYSHVPQSGGGVGMYFTRLSQRAVCAVPIRPVFLWTTVEDGK